VVSVEMVSRYSTSSYVTDKPGIPSSVSGI